MHPPEPHLRSTALRLDAFGSPGGALLTSPTYAGPPRPADGARACLVHLLHVASRHLRSRPHGAAALGAAVGILLSAALAHADEVVYVANFRSDTLSIFGTDEDATTASLPLATAADAAAVQQIPGENPQGAAAGLAIGGPVAVALSPDGAIAYVVETGSPGALLVVDLHIRRILGTVPLGNESFALAVSPDGKEIYAANFGSDTISVVDADARRVVATIPVGDGPSAVAMNRARAYVANTAAGTVSVIDVGTRTSIGEVVVGQAPFGVALSAEALYVAQSAGDSVAVIDIGDNRVSAIIAVGKAPTMVALSPDAKRAYVSNPGDGSVSVIDTATNNVTATVHVGAEPFGLAVSHEGDRLVVANRAGNSVSVVDTQTQAVRRRVTVGTSPFGLAVGRRLDGGGCHCAAQPAASRSASRAGALGAALLLLWARRGLRESQSR